MKYRCLNYMINPMTSRVYVCVAACRYHERHASFEEIGIQKRPNVIVNKLCTKNTTHAKYSDYLSQLLDDGVDMMTWLT